MDKKKICFFSGDITNSGGTERVATIIASELSNINKYEICILSLTEHTSDTHFFLSENISRYKLFNNKKNGVKNFFQIVIQLNKFIKKNKIDIIIDIDGILDMFSLPVKFFQKVKVISWEHFNYYETLNNPFRMFIRKLTDNLLIYSNAYREDKGYYIENLKKIKRIEQIYNPIELIKNVGTYNADTKMIISAGRLTHQKGFDILVDVAKLVFDKHPDWNWIILGEGEDEKILKNKIMEYGIENKLILQGKVSNVNDYYRKSDIYIMTSRFEGFPLVLIEAKSNGLPIVSFKCRTGPEEMIQEGINGYLIDCFDVVEMANKILLLISDEQKRIEFSKKSLLDTEKLDKKYVINQWERLIESL